MSKQLYEEALADAKKLREVAEDNAKRALVEAVTPRIRDLIEKELLREFTESCDDSWNAPGVPEYPSNFELMGDGTEQDLVDVSEPYDYPPEDDMEMSDGAPVDDPTMFGSGPDLEDDMLSALMGGQATYKLTPESLNTLMPFMGMISENKNIPLRLTKLGDAIADAKYSLLFIKESGSQSNKINNLISETEDLYTYIQESFSDSNKKSEYELTLEAFYNELNQLQEQNMSRNYFRRRLHEENEMEMPAGEAGTELSLKISLPNASADALRDATATLEGEDDMGGADGEEGEDEEELELDFGDEDAPEGGDEFEDMPEDDEEPELQKDAYMPESRRRRNDNLVVEIDEGMLRREIGRMKMLREARNRNMRRLHEEKFKAPKNAGKGPGDLYDFGGGPESEDEPLDVDIRYESRGRSRDGAARNSTPNRHAVQAETNLRAKLAESNLFNAKLIYTNKLLQNESLSKRQKAEIIERLDEARNLREVKLVYESLTKALAGTSRPLSESAERRVLGSSSRATRPASTNLNEGFETDRWARLAGITK